MNIEQKTVKMKNLPAFAAGRERARAGRHPFLFLFALAVFINTAIEMLARLSPAEGLAYMISRPLSFLLNSLVLFLTFSLCLLFRRRFFVLTLIAALWLVLGITNAVVVFMRASPLSGIDFLILRSCLPIVKIYLRFWHVLLILVFLAGLTAFLAGFYRRSRTYAVRFEREVVLFCTAVLLAGGGIFLSVKTGAVGQSFSDLPAAYEEYGFVTCFSRTVLERGIPEPESYSEQVLAALKNTLEDDGAEADGGGRKPNVVALQLESFMDPERIRGAAYTESPAPFFRDLKERFPSGFLRVNTVGAGTANTEFEILTGIDLTFFGAGEYPYQTVLGEEGAVCESMASDLKAAGYSARAVHNHSASFYDRPAAYAALGFDGFVPLEYMNGTEDNPLGWAKDGILTDVVRECLDGTEGPDFVFTVSVQGHGLYPNEPEDAENGTPVGVAEIPAGWTEAEAAQLSYYVGQVREMDDFLRAFCRMLEQRADETGEPTVLLLYGDHLPPLPFDDAYDGEQALSDGSDPLCSEYVIVPVGFDPAPDWGEDRDLEAWEAGMRTLTLAGCHDGLINRCHSRLGEGEGFREALNLLAHDMLYGGRYAWDGRAPFRRGSLEMGIREISVLSAVISPAGESAFFGAEPAGVLTVRGRNFTPWSVVTVNGRPQRTEFLSPEELRTEVRAEAGDAVAVIQRTEDYIVLGSTESVPASAERVRPSES